MNPEYVKRLEQFRKEPSVGQFLIFQEYRDGHGWGIYPVVDVVSFDDLSENMEVSEYDSRCLEVQGWCDSSGYDGIVFLELWDNGEAYLSGDGVRHDRYRVVGMMEVDLEVDLGGVDDPLDDQLTEMDGVPVCWSIWEQDWRPDRPGTKVEFRVKVYRDGQAHWYSRKEFGSTKEAVDKLVAEAREELGRPKYYCSDREIRVDGEVAWGSHR